MTEAGTWRLAHEAGWAALALFASCAALAQAPAATKPAASAQSPSIVLRFDWGAKLEANVVAVRDEIVENGDSKRASAFVARFKMHVARDDKAYAITFSDLTAAIDGRSIPANAQPEMMGPVSGLVPSYDVGLTGDFVGLRNFESLQRYTEQSYLSQVDNLPPRERPSGEVTQHALNTGTSREVLQLNASRTWSALVGMWAGQEMREGQSITSDSSVTIPVLNAPVTLRTTSTFVRREACSTSDRKLSCVRLRATSRPDATELSSAIERFAKSAGKDGVASGEMDVQFQYDILTEPGTLRPHKAEWIQIARFSSTDDGIQREDGGQSSKMTMTFDYGK